MVEGNGEIIVIDNGSAYCRVGFSGDDSPTAIFPTLIGKPKLVDDSTKEFYVGDEARTNRRKLSLVFPVKRGIITHWKEMEKIWHHAFYNKLKIDPKEHPVVLTEVPLNAKANTRRIVKILFEKFNIASIYLTCHSVAALFCSGRATGVVLDSGAGATHSVSIYEGYAIPHATMRIEVDGNDLTEYLTKLLMERDVSLAMNMELVQDIKENMCYVAQDYEVELTKDQDSTKERRYKLPDESNLILEKERFMCPEALFQPALLGMEGNGVHQALSECILKSDIDIRDDLYANIVLSGGSMLFAGMKERIHRELSTLAPTGTVIKTSDNSSVEHPAWCGLSIVSNLHWYMVMLRTREEYDEQGPGIIHRVNF